MNLLEFFRAAYGILLLGTLMGLLPHVQRFFISERWRGYARSSWKTNVIQHPLVTAAIMVLWFASAICIVFGWFLVFTSLINLILSRYYFISMRWTSLTRGSGAPGFMTYWLGACVFLLEFARYLNPESVPLVIRVLQVDFAFIMISSGIYKLTAGYARGEGVEYGLVNPQWGYWWKFYSGMNPNHVSFRFLNHAAWMTEILAGVLMLFPKTCVFGALLIAGSFTYIRTQIRLGLLCEMVILGTLLFFVPAGPVFPEKLSVLTGCLWGYLVLLPLSHAGLFYNFYAKKSLPGILQRVLDAYTNFFGLILWRVFSVDVVNFFILIYRAENGNLAKRELISRHGWEGGFRFNHVTESITVTSVFTTLKYYPKNRGLFEERLLRYARTFLCPRNCVLIFQYVSIQKSRDRFHFIPVREYLVRPETGSIEEKVLDMALDVGKAHHTSPLHAGVRPGSYVPYPVECSQAL